MDKIKQDIILNTEDKFKLVNGVTKLKTEEEGIDLINDVALQVYKKPRHSEEINLYKVILNSITEKKDKELFRSFIENIEPNIYNKNDIVQKVMISSILLNKLFLLKHHNKNMDIFKITKGIEYKENTATWLNIMLQYTIPVLLNNNIIKEMKNV